VGCILFFIRFVRCSLCFAGPEKRKENSYLPTCLSLSTTTRANKGLTAAATKKKKKNSSWKRPSACFDAAAAAAPQRLHPPSSNRNPRQKAKQNKRPRPLTIQEPANSIAPSNQSRRQHGFLLVRGTH
jgi:hypothetical protein